MGWLKTLQNWASNAWGSIFGAATNPVAALTNLWHYITSLHDALAWLGANPLVKGYKSFLLNFTVIGLAIRAAQAAIGRIGAWVWSHEVKPVRDQLRAAITALKAWAVAMFAAQQAEIIARYLAALAYTRKLVGIERAQRMKGDRLEHAAMLKAVAACLATVQQQAASAYNAGLNARLGVIGTILEDMAGHTPLIKDAVEFLLKDWVDIENIDDPVIRWLANKAIDEIVNNAEVDKAAGSLAQTLLGPIIGQPRAKGLHDVISDISARLAAMEAQWATFMKDGGPEVEQAGKEWKEITGTLVNLGFLGFTGLAATDPAAWATGVSDSVGTVANDSIGAIVGLIGKI